MNDEDNYQSDFLFSHNVFSSSFHVFFGKPMWYLEAGFQQFLRWQFHCSNKLSYVQVGRHQNPITAIPQLQSSGRKWNRGYSEERWRGDEEIWVELLEEVKGEEREL